MRTASLRLALASALAFATLDAATPSNALACGGCFHGPSDTVTSVTSHRMAVAIHPGESILWDQIRYAGNPADFSWVLPVWGDVRIELASSEFFDSLEADTAVQVDSPPLSTSCGMPSGGGGGFGCNAPASYAASSDASARDSSVTVLHESTVGPYETVTLRSTDPMSLTDWLAMHQYVVPPAVQPVIQYYVDHGMDFVALRLQPGQGVQAMRPIRIRYSTANMVLPLRMISAGVTDKVGLTLYVFGAGRYEPANFGRGQVDPAQVVWDWDTNGSNYRALFTSTIQSLGGRAWLTEFSGEESLLARGRSADELADWQLANSNGAHTVTRIRTDLAAAFLDADLQLQASVQNTAVSNVIRATRSTGTEPVARCASIVMFPAHESMLRRPGRMILGAFASALAIFVTRRVQRRSKNR